MQFKLNQTFGVRITLDFVILKRFYHILFVEQSFNLKMR